MLHCRLATRNSRLARAQSDAVGQSLERLFPELRVEIIPIRTEGDIVLDTPLRLAGGKGLFTRAIDEALLNETADLAVHSLKDLPVEPTPGLCIAAIPERESDADCLVGAEGETLSDIPPGATIASGSLRRKAQLLRVRPDLTVMPIRGNVETRIRIAREKGYFGTILAEAGLNRLGLSETPRIPLADVLLPAAGQGALGITTRTNVGELADLLKPLHHQSSALRAQAERACLHALDAGCHAPVGTRSRLDGNRLELRAGVFSPDGTKAIETTLTGDGSAPEELGERVAEALRAQGSDELIRNAMSEDEA